MQFIHRIRLRGLLSFPPDMEFLDLQPLNVLIGPNGAGKTNLLEAFKLLGATPTDFASAVRNGGGAKEWLWKGENPADAAELDVVTGDAVPATGRPLRYRLEFGSANFRSEVVDEAIEEVKPDVGHEEPCFYYRFQRGQPIINRRGTAENGNCPRVETHLDRYDLLPDQSILSQYKDPYFHSEMHWLGGKFGQIRTFRDWSFGPRSVLRNPQPTSDPTEELLPDARNFALVLNEILHRGGSDIETALKQFLPRFERLSFRIFDNALMPYIHEQGLNAAVPVLRMSDGTLRLLGMLSALFAPTPPSLMCLEEPELGMHPDSMSLLAELLVEASNRMQLVVTTHSDALLSALNDKVESILVCENNGYGTNIKSLDVERLALWLNDHTLGDIWRIGEIGGNP